MGRRDEPELEELSKLLRRLETMEVTPKQEIARPPERDAAQPPAEYVGALRGAAPAKVSDDQRGSSYDKATHRALDTQSRADKNARSASTPIVIGATTAAVVSSVVAAGLVLWINGSGEKKTEGERRLTFYAPAEPSGRARDPTATPPRRRFGMVRLRRSRRTCRRFCSAPISTCAAANPARHGSCWSRRRSSARALPH